MRYGMHMHPPGMPGMNVYTWVLIIIIIIIIITTYIKLVVHLLPCIAPEGRVAWLSAIWGESGVQDIVYGNSPWLRKASKLRDERYREKKPPTFDLVGV